VPPASDPLRWVLFDLDGTLFDYHAAETAAVAATLADAGLPASDELMTAYRASNARAWRDLERGAITPERLRVERWQRVLAEHPGASLSVAELASRYTSHLSRGTQLLPYAEQVVGEVARDHRIGFVTNGLADVQRPRLAASPFAEVAEVVVISEEVGAAKPDRRFFEVTFEAMGRPDPATVTLVGDSLSADIAGGVAYGLITVWVTDPGVPDPSPPDPVPTHRIAGLDELPPWLASWAGRAVPAPPGA
jgi:YjjG family noncanonical pyrimidine nucleotidase